jgi:hypothetical protein
MNRLGEGGGGHRLDGSGLDKDKCQSVLNMVASIKRGEFLDSG